MARDAGAKHWVFTLNNPTEEDEALIPLDKLEYIVIGREVGESGTPHWQGYLSLKTKSRLTAMKKIFGRAHWEIMRGTPKEASDYCKKDGDILIEHGTLPETKGDVTRRRWAEAKEKAILGNIEEIEPQLYIQYYNTFKRIKTDHAPKMKSIDVLDNEWHWGPTGTGKSRIVRTQYPDAFIKDANQWWDGYNGEEVVIIEDVDKYDVKLGRWLKLWGDHYAFPADMKHQGKLDIRPRKIIITSNYTPSDIWSDVRTTEPIERRYRIIEYPIKEIS